MEILRKTYWRLRLRVTVQRLRLEGDMVEAEARVDREGADIANERYLLLSITPLITIIFAASQLMINDSFIVNLLLCKQ